MKTTKPSLAHLRTASFKDWDLETTSVLPSPKGAPPPESERLGAPFRIAKPADKADSPVESEMLEGAPYPTPRPSAPELPAPEVTVPPSPRLPSSLADDTPVVPADSVQPNLMSTPRPADRLVRHATLVSETNSWDEQPEVKPATPVRSHAVNLLWLDADRSQRVFEQEQWQTAIDAADERDADGSLGDTLGLDGNPLELVGTIAEVLGTCAASCLRSLEHRLADAVDDDGRLTAPLALVEGQLELSLDAEQKLSELAAIASTYAEGDTKLSETVDQARRLLAGPKLPDTLLEGGANQLGERLAARATGLQTASLNSQIERALVRARAFRKCKVLGGLKVRAQLRGDRANRAGSAIVYLPLELVERLPLFRSLPVRMIVEVYLRQDQGEVHSVALRPVAVARTFQTSAANAA